MDIFITNVIPIINITDIDINIASKILNVSPICDNKSTIFASAIGWHRAAVIWYVIVNIASFIIGNTHIPIITITPTVPIAFFSILLHPITVSTASPNIFPTTGTKFDIAALVVFAVKPVNTTR